MSIDDEPTRPATTFPLDESEDNPVEDVLPAAIALALRLAARPWAGASAAPPLTRSGDRELRILVNDVGYGAGVVIRPR